MGQALGHQTWPDRDDSDTAPAGRNRKDIYNQHMRRTVSRVTQVTEQRGAARQGWNLNMSRRKRAPNRPAMKTSKRQTVELGQRCSKV